MPKVNRSITIRVKCPEYMFSKLWSITVGKEIPIYFLELLNCQVTTGTVLEEALVPLLDLCVRKLGVGLQVGHHLWPDLAALVITHGFEKRQPDPANVWNGKKMTWIKKLLCPRHEKANLEDIENKWDLHSLYSVQGPRLFKSNKQKMMYSTVCTLTQYFCS